MSKCWKLLPPNGLGRRWQATDGHVIVAAIDPAGSHPFVLYAPGGGPALRFGTFSAAARAAERHQLRAA